MTDPVIEGIRQTCNAIKDDVGDLKVSVGKVEQHMHDMNGSIKRHEGEIKAIEKGLVKNTVSIAKQAGVGGLGGIIVFAVAKAIEMMI